MQTSTVVRAKDLQKIKNARRSYAPGVIKMLLFIHRSMLVPGACFNTDIKNVRLTERMYGWRKYYDRLMNKIAWMKYWRQA